MAGLEANAYPCLGTTLGATKVTIRNGLYHIRIEFLDSVQDGNQGVMVSRDGTMRVGKQSIRFRGSLRLLIPD